MKKSKNRVNANLGLLIIAVLVAISVGGWYAFKANSNETPNNQTSSPQTQNKTGNFYKIIGTKDYKCTKSIPAQCSGNIKIESLNSNKSQKTVTIEKDTEFYGIDPAVLYETDKRPQTAELELKENQVINIKLL